jgi:hypothetical protein
MNPKTAAYASIILFGVWVAFNLILVSMGRVDDPWHQLGLYSIGGIAFAVASSGLGIYARVKGKCSLDSRSLGLALIPILGGGSFLIYIAISAFGLS